MTGAGRIIPMHVLHKSTTFSTRKRMTYSGLSLQFFFHLQFGDIVIFLPSTRAGAFWLNCFMNHGD